MEDSKLTYREAVRLDRPDALMLGVDGRGPEASARRLEVAITVRDGHSEAQDQAYMRAAEERRSDEPVLTTPFGVAELIRAGGDVQAVVDGPEFQNLVLDSMGLAGGEQIVADEDGVRWEYVEPGEYDIEAAREEAVAIRATLVERGVITDEVLIPADEADPTADARQMRAATFPSAANRFQPGAAAGRAVTPAGRGAEQEHEVPF